MRGKGYLSAAIARYWLSHLTDFWMGYLNALLPLARFTL
jgi:hypothetical protein